jgi:hypothetical protein
MGGQWEWDFLRLKTPFADQDVTRHLGSIDPQSERDLLGFFVGEKVDRLGSAQCRFT